MKNFILTLVVCIFCYTGIWGQSAAHYYNKGKYLSDKANNKLAKMKVFNKEENGKLIELYKSSVENYQNTKNEMPATKYLVSYNASLNLYYAAQQYHAAGDDANAYTTLKQAMEIWPVIKDIPATEVTKEKSIFLKGNIYTYPAAATAEDRFKNYYETRYLAAILAKNLGKKEEALQYSKEIADNVSDIPEITWESSYDVAAAMHKEQQHCDASVYALVCIENAARIQPTGNEKEIAAKNNMIDEMTRYLTIADSQSCLKTSILEKAVAALASMKGKWTPKTKYAYALGEKIYNAGGHSFDLLYNEYRLARTHNDPDISETWRLRMVQYGKNFNSDQWKELADYYYALSNTEARTEALDNAQKRQKKENTAFLIGIEPTSMLLGQFAGSFAYQGEKVSHEIRLGYIPDGIKPFLKSGGDTEKVPLYLLSHYHGYQASYSLKILSQGENKKAYNYFGFELRYTSRDYTDNLTSYNKAVPTEKSNTKLDPHADVYDACAVFGGITKGKLLYMDIFGGVGIGYKKLSFNNTFDPTTEAIANAPFKAGNWDILYVPIRIGVRVGFVVRQAPYKP
jgi:hypothetical protein